MMGRTTVAAPGDDFLPPLLERLHTRMQSLGLLEADGLLEGHLERASKRELTYAEFLLELLEEEQRFRSQRALHTRMQLAGLPRGKTLESFDFDFQPSIDERTVRELSTLRFAREAENVILLGPPGVGKTHLAAGLACEAVKGGFSAYFITAHDLTVNLASAAREGRLAQQMKIYLRPKVLVIDEVGYLPVDEKGASILFQLISARYERGSILLTSNKSYGEWGSVFGETTIAAAILDRLLHHSTTINIRGESYRLKDRRRAGLLGSPTLSPAGLPKTSPPTAGPTAGPTPGLTAGLTPGAASGTMKGEPEGRGPTPSAGTAPNRHSDPDA